MNVDVALGIIGMQTAAIWVVGGKAGDEVDCCMAAGDVVLEEGVTHRCPADGECRIS